MKKYKYKFTNSATGQLVCEVEGSKVDVVKGNSEITFYIVYKKNPAGYGEIVARLPMNGLIQTQEEIV